MRENLKVAIVHDWLVMTGGAEKVLERMISAFPDADLFSICDFLSDDDRKMVKGKRAKTSFVQKLPWAKTKYRSYLPLMPLAIEQFDLSEYDLIISSSYAVAKGVITGPDQLHVCMCYSPIRYAWDLMHQYLAETGKERGVLSWVVRYLLHRIRIWDVRTANSVDHFISISRYISGRIKKCYRRESTVIYPPVDCDKYRLSETKEDFYLTASRLVPYKRIDLIVEAFSKMPDKKLVVIGDGPEFRKIAAKASPNVTLMGYQPDSVLIEKMSRARAFVFAACEDFGIVPLEAQACGTPVIAYGRGGALETVIDGVSGLFFGEQTIDSLIEAVSKFEQNEKQFLPELIRKHAENFSTRRFDHEFSAFMDNLLADNRSDLLTRRLTLKRGGDRETEPKPETDPIIDVSATHPAAMEHSIK
ncbi:MAG: glycosyltransferase family 4 protein [bacterium]|nr:glycosyltransferase family 4 protein [bacterium]